MKIRTKIALQFSLIVGMILILTFGSIYLLLEQSRKADFYKRLKNRALTTAKLLIEVKEIDRRLLKKIDRKTFTELYAEKVLMFDDKNKLVYASIDAETIYYSPELLDEARTKGYTETHLGDDEIIATIYEDPKQAKTFVVVASASDTLGKMQLESIRASLIVVLLVGMVLTVLLGILFAGQSLRPIAVMNQEIKKITAYNLKQRLNESNKQDEVAQLAINFNRMLQRLEQSFELQRSFVSNASHELRTPLAALKSEIQVSLEKNRSPDDYQKILESLLADTQRLIQLSNGLLQLAQSESKERNMVVQAIRIDELLFTIQEEITSQNPKYQVSIDFEEIPESEDAVSILANETLLKSVFSNLIDNACKYSENRKAEVIIGFTKKFCTVKVKDKGIGIPESEIKKIFEPFYRANNATTFKGHGIGLSVCRRIVDMYQGYLEVSSKVDEGSNFYVSLPHL